MNSSCTPLNVRASVPPTESAQFSSAAVDGQLNDIILNAFWLGALVPIGIALILTSSHLWKKPVFILNVCAIVCAFAFGGLTVTDAKDTLVGRPGNMHRIQALVFLSFFIPICTQSILLVRILAVYPPRLLPWKKNLLVYGVLAVVLIARIINMGVCLNQIISELRTSVDVFIGWQSTFVRVEWFLQLFYVMYASTLFLTRLREGSPLTLRRRIGTSVPYSNSQQRSTYADRLRALFWIAVFNFVFPTILNIIAIIFIFRSSDSFALTDLVITNLYVEIVCVLLATIWCSGKYWESGHPSDDIELKPKSDLVESMDSATFATPNPSMLTPSHGGHGHTHSSTVFVGQGEKE